MNVIHTLAKIPLPLDLAQGSQKHNTKGKQIAFAAVPHPIPNSKALDIGCGDGYWSEKLKNLGYHVTSIDQQRTYPNVDSDRQYTHMVPADANKNLPFPDASFDLVWCSEVIEHLINYQHTLQEIQRVLKPGGTYILTTPNSYFWLYYIIRACGLHHKDWQNEGHVNFFHLKDVKAAFPKASILGFFPYAIFKCTIRRWLSLLTPTFVIIGKK